MANPRRRVTSIRKKSTGIVERNTELVGQFMRYILAQPEILESLPDNFRLVILPQGDAELRQFNLDRLDEYAKQSQPIVFVRLGPGNKMDFKTDQPHVYAPIAI